MNGFIIPEQQAFVKPQKKSTLRRALIFAGTVRHKRSPARRGESQRIYVRDRRRFAPSVLRLREQAPRSVFPQDPGGRLVGKDLPGGYVRA